MRILIVDDEMVSREKMRIMLRAIGECDLAECGQEALDKFSTAWEKKPRYDLVTLDISMPDMDGLEVLRSIRKIEAEKAEPGYERAKVIMVTGDGESSTVINCLKEGCDDYMLKPLDRKSVSDKIKCYS